MGDNLNKPPLGLKPGWLHDEERQTEIAAAIIRWMEAGREIPIEWISEYNVLAIRRAQRQSE